MSSRLLVTGGCGLIGSALAEHALAAGERVVVLDNLSTGRRGNLPRDPRIELVVGDICDDSLVGALMRRCDRVAHLAAGVGVGLVMGRPTGALRQSLIGNETVLRHAASARRPLFFASTSEVYGDSDGAPLRESDPAGFGPPERVRWSYAAGKAAGEALAFCYAREYGLPLVVGRFFNVTGPRQRATHGAVVPTFVAQAMRGGPITVHGDGSQTRCFSDVRDAAAQIALLLDRATPAGLLVNIGSAEPVTVLDLARRIRRLVDSALEIRLSDHGYGDGFAAIRHRRPDLARIRAATGYVPRYSLDETLESCLVSARTQSR